MALSGTELVEVRLADAKGHPSASSTLMRLNQLTSLPAGSTVEVTPAITKGAQRAVPQTIKVSSLGSVGANDTIDLHTLVGPAIAGTSGKKQPTQASQVNAFVS